MSISAFTIYPIMFHTSEDLNMPIGPWEILILLIIFLGILLISRRQTSEFVLDAVCDPVVYY